MSTLKVTNIQATGETASRAVSGVAAAWVDFTTITTTAVRDSLNVASLTDLGAGATTINYTSSMSSSNYAGVMYTGAGDASTAYNNFNNQYLGGFGSKSTSSISLGAYNASFVDSYKNDAIIMGDLA
jgi:hypothetical protein